MKIKPSEVLRRVKNLYEEGLEDWDDIMGQIAPDQETYTLANDAFQEALHSFMLAAFDRAIAHTEQKEVAE